MNKKTLLKYIAGNCSEKEEHEVLKWASRNKKNEEYFIWLKNTCVSATMPDTKASDEEMTIFRSCLAKRERRIIKSDRRRILLAYTSYAAAAVAAIALIINVTSIPSRDEVVSEYLSLNLNDIPDNFIKEVYTEPGVKANITLPDGSRVWLNSDSKLRFPDRFMGNTRSVELSGEAYFEVEKDSLMPMIISTPKNFKVEVRGTSFNLKCYEDEEEAVATLYSGSINLLSSDDGSDSRGRVITEIKPNEMYSIKENLPEPVNIIAPDIKNASAWKDGRLVFESTRMDEVIRMLKRWHGTEIVVDDPEILNFRITATFRKESMIQIAEMLKFCALIDYSIEKEVFHFFKRK